MVCVSKSPLVPEHTSEFYFSLLLRELATLSLSPATQRPIDAHVHNAAKMGGRRDIAVFSPNISDFFFYVSPRRFPLSCAQVLRIVNSVLNAGLLFGQSWPSQTESQDGPIHPRLSDSGNGGISVYKQCFGVRMMCFGPILG